MGFKNLAEAIILQSIEDLWDEDHREHCIKFFAGEGFGICAGMAGINFSDKVKLLNLINESIKHGSKPKKSLQNGNHIEYSVSRGR